MGRKKPAWTSSYDTNIQLHPVASTTVLESHSLKDDLVGPSF